VEVDSVQNAAKTFGEPIIRSENITNSTVCGPSFIGPKVSLVNCYIAPGTIITGESNVSNTRILGGILHNTVVTDSEFESVISAENIVEHIKLIDSTIPAGSVIRSER